MDIMEKIYLKYDDVRPCVECDYGFVKEMVYLGFLYPYKKGDLKHFFIMMSLQLAVCTLLIALFIVGYRLNIYNPLTINDMHITCKSNGTEPY